MRRRACTRLCHHLHSHTGAEAQGRQQRGRVIPGEQPWLIQNALSQGLADPKNIWGDWRHDNIEIREGWHLFRDLGADAHISWDALHGVRQQPAVNNGQWVGH